MTKSTDNIVLAVHAQDNYARSSLRVIETAVPFNNVDWLDNVVF